MARINTCLLKVETVTTAFLVLAEFISWQIQTICVIFILFAVSCSYNRFFLMDIKLVLVPSMGNDTPISTCTRFWSSGPKEIFGVIVEIQSLESFSASFLQTRMWKMSRIHIITTLRVHIAHVVGPILILMLKIK